MNDTETLWTQDATTQAEVEKLLLEEQKRVDYDTTEFTTELLAKKLADNDIVIPAYQRDFIWPLDKQSRLIESLMLGLPIPFLFAADIPKSGKLEIVDGVQRLRTIESFLSDKLVLRELQKLGFINGFRYSSLPDSQRRRFRNRTLRMIVISAHSDQDVRFDIFERINTGSVVLTPAEFRRGAFPGPFYNLVTTCASDAGFRQECPIGKATAKRREHEELVLRFFAYSQRYRNFQHDVTRFLNDYLRDLNRTCGARDGPRILEARQGDFDRMIAFVSEHFPFGFRKTRAARTTPRVRFEAISVGVHLAFERDPRLSTRDVTWLDSDGFVAETTTHASNSGPRLRARVEYVRDKLLGAT